MENYNPYQAPNSDLDDYDDDYDIPPLYNPNAAALWSILFTPFGAWIHAKNWEAIGEEQLAKQNYWYVIAVFAFIFGTTLLEMTTGFALPSTGVSIGLLLGWYFSLGKKQIALFKEELGTDYEKKSLVVPVLAGVFGGMVAVVAVLIGLQVLLEMFGLLHPSWLAE